LKLLIIFLLNIVPCCHAIRLGLNEPRIFLYSAMLALCALVIRDVHINKVYLAFVALILFMALLTLVCVLDFISRSAGRLNLEASVHL